MYHLGYIGFRIIGMFKELVYKKQIELKNLILTHKVVKKEKLMSLGIYMISK